MTDIMTFQNIDLSPWDTLCKGKISRLNICACNSWGMTLNFTLDVYHSITCRTGKVEEETGKVDGTEAYI
jgi:hypothetical protein